jgi:hypothetical protein
MKKLFTLVTFIIFSIGAYSQEVSCEDLKNFIEKKGRYYASLSSVVLNSSWLNKVTCYTYEGKNYVVAEIRKNEYSYTTKSYIFCGIPNTNWFGFYHGNDYVDIRKTYGERFHKYIIDYQCNCY